MGKQYFLRERGKFLLGIYVYNKYLDNPPDVVKASGFSRACLIDNHGNEVWDDGEDINNVHDALDELALLRSTLNGQKIRKK